MNTVTPNSRRNEGTAFEIPQLDAGAQPDCAPESAVRSGEAETEAADAAIARQAAIAPRASAAARWSGLAGIASPAESTVARRRSIVSTIRDILDTAEARAARAEERARQAEELLALHERHCICRAGKVAEAIAQEMVCEAVDATAASQGSAFGDEAGDPAGSSAHLHPSGTVAVTR
ncbi:MAG: hypothetical protein MEQ84_02625 [Mesorhizobium sp.]|nr:hypothetical protein [Mesorhizobium sp.]